MDIKNVKNGARMRKLRILQVRGTHTETIYTLHILVRPAYSDTRLRIVHVDQTLRPRMRSAVMQANAQRNLGVRPAYEVRPA